MSLSRKKGRNHFKAGHNSKRSCMQPALGTSKLKSMNSLWSKGHGIVCMFAHPAWHWYFVRSLKALSMCVLKAAMITRQGERERERAHTHINVNTLIFPSESTSFPWYLSLVPPLLPFCLEVKQTHRHWRVISWCLSCCWDKYTDTQTHTNQCLKAPYSQLTGHKTYTSTKALQHSWKQQPQHAFNGQGSKVISMRKWQRVKGVKQSIRHLTFPLLLLLRTAAEETEMENFHETKASLQHCII